MDERGRIVVFAGAGASFAVNKNKYPTTAGFLEKFPEDLKQNQLIGYISNHFKVRFGDGTPDVEKILWCLGELLAYLELTQDNKSPVNWLLPGNTLPGLLQIEGNVSAFAAVAKKAIPQIKSLQDRINAQLYDVYGELPVPEELESNWTYLLNDLAKKDLWLDLVTTNYDLVLESAVDLLDGEIGYGQQRGAVPFLDLSRWKKYLTEKKLPYQSGLITKLHGSVNWERNRDQVVFSGTTFKSDHKHHAAIYPGFKGVPTDEPFSLLHDYFERALERANHVVFIGFAFRDEYINQLLRRSFQKNQVVVVDPTDLPNMPRDLRSRVHHIKSGFGKEAVKQVLFLLKEQF